MRKSDLKSLARIAAFGWIFAGFLAAAVPAVAQNAAAPGFPAIPAALEKKLAARASNVDEVTLDKNMLNMGSQFLDPKKQDDRQVQQFIRKLNGIYVRNFEFDQAGAYTEQDLEAILRQFIGPQWSSMVHERSTKKGETSDVYMRMVDGEIQGMFVLDAEPKELNLVYISGSIDPKDIGQLSGNFGIPDINTGSNSSKSGSAK